VRAKDGAKNALFLVRFIAYGIFIYTQLKKGEFIMNELKAIIITVTISLVTGLAALLGAYLHS
jgi:hypothetical protein